MRKDLFIGQHHYMYLSDEEYEIATTDHGKAVLEEAPKYKYVVNIWVSQRLLEHIKTKYQFIPNPDVYNYTGIVNNMEVTIGILPSKGEGGILSIFCSKKLIKMNEAETSEDIFAQKVNWDKQLIKKVGLEKILDPNSGGSITDDTMQYASLIIFG